MGSEEGRLRPDRKRLAQLETSPIGIGNRCRPVGCCTRGHVMSSIGILGHYTILTAQKPSDQRH